MPQRHTLDCAPPIADGPEEIARDVLAVNQLEAVPTLLDVLCEITGMRFAAVARVTEGTWTACVVKDNINLGLKAGGQLEVEKTLCIESKRANAPIIIEYASMDRRYCNHPAKALFNIESYVCMPIVMGDGRYFGNLIAIDPAPAKVSSPQIVGMFERFATLIAAQLQAEIRRITDQSALRDERAASELREQFIAILGHDLRNPLQAILGTSDIIGKKASDPTIAGMASRIKANAERMSSLIDDVLDFARGRLGGGIGLELTEVDDVGAGLITVVKELQDAQPGREISANISVTRKVHCDLERIQQVASNLIGNALSHGDSRSPVKVTALTDDHFFTLEVCNEGEPIPPENIDKIFEPFWRSRGAGNRQGLGLGLHICSQIVRAHGGKLSVTSTREAGTKFTASLALQVPP